MSWKKFYFVFLGILYSVVFFTLVEDFTTFRIIKKGFIQSGDKYYSVRLEQEKVWVSTEVLPDIIFRS